LAGLGHTGRGPGLAALIQIMEAHPVPATRRQALNALEGVCKVHYLDVPDPTDASWARQVEKIRRLYWVHDSLVTSTNAPAGGPP